MTEENPGSRRPLDEEILVEQARYDPAAFAVLYDRYVQPVFRYIASRQGNLQSAEAMTAQTFLTARKTLPHDLTGKNFAAWLFSVARGQLAAYLRGGGRLEPPARPSGAAAESLESLRRLIRGLSAGEQELLRLRCAAGLGFDALAGLVGAAPEEIKREFDRMLNRLLSQAAAGQADYPRDMRWFETQVCEAVRGPDASPGFVARLRSQLLPSAVPAAPAQAAPAAPQKAPHEAPPARLPVLSGPAWALLLLALALTLLLAAVLAIGPQRLWEEALALAGIGLEEPRSGQPSGAPPEQSAATLPASQQPNISPSPGYPVEGISTGDPAGVRFTLEQVTELEDGYLLQGSLHWQETAFATLAFDPYLLELNAADGAPVPLELAEPDPAAYDPAGFRMPWAVRIVGKDYPGPLTLTLPVLEGYQEITGAAFDLDLGAVPSPGQTWPLDLPLEAAGRQIRVLGAGLNRSADGAYRLELTFQADSQQVTGLQLSDLGSPAAQSGSQGGADGQGRRVESLAYPSLPGGVRRIELIGLWIQAGGRWTISIPLPSRP